MKDSVRIVLTGGTIDSYWDGTKDTAIPLEHSALPKFIEGLRLYIPVEFTEVCMKDSRSLTQNDRAAIVKAITSSSEKKIIITHGTYTMPDTAKYLEAHLPKDNDKIIILTGSMIPLTGFAPSDAPFNVGFAFSNLDHQKPGVYVAMNGKIFSPGEVVKLLNEGRFASVLGG